MCVMLTGICSLTVLLRVSSPFTKQRRIIFFSMGAIFALCLIFLKDLFMIVALDLFSFGIVCASIVVIPILMTSLYFVLKRFQNINQRIREATEKK